MTVPRSPDAFARGEPLSTEDFRAEARRVAPDLLGALLVVEPGEDRSDGASEDAVGGIVVETEAYVNGVDPASHLAAGRTPRTASFFGGPGTLYVYTIHGHHALNVITAHDGYPEGMLIRALEPTHGLDVMRRRRGFHDPAKLMSGPGKLAAALGVTTDAFDGRPLGETRLSLYETNLDPDVAISGRVGISEAEDWPLRFSVAGSPFVSCPAPSDGGLDHEAVERCYDRLREDCPDAHSLDRDA